MTAGTPIGEATRRHWLPVALGAVLVAYLVVPFVAFLAHTGAADIGSRLTAPDARAAIRTSLATATAATVLATVFGVPLAYTLARATFPGKRLVNGLVVLPLVVPPLVGGTMLLTVVGRFTPLGAWAAAAGIPLTNSPIGVVLAQTFVAAPFLVVAARSGFDGVDPRFEDAARSLGRGPLATFWTVSIPLARPAILAGIVLTFARALGEFGATMMVATTPRTVPIRIWVAFRSDGIDAVVPLAVALLVITLFVVGAVHRLGEQAAAVPSE
ncbi:ABC transporter permease [Halobacterium salinarum]|uniref:ABC transporter permease n=1 Tax=Halobacterium salinarum TaxID=2242 RepID=UPI001F328ECF|nr:ABC transporter permease [Halobacterium salinarum]MCF2165970.1 ABC transporter permease [Halobacterium salinarum]MCF2167489.1 ABC transporter permease [Halobacterium salinarum]